MPPYAGVGIENLLASGMRVAALNHRVLANNIANADTPFFTPSEMDFDSTLRAMVAGRDRVDLRTTSRSHLAHGTQTTKIDRVAGMSKNDYNKVDVDEQLANLSRNTGRFNTYAALLRSRFQQRSQMLQSLSR